jgi:AcrR family transcriptional regulator
MTDMLDAAQGQSGGLRERKKARTRASIREHAFRLFREQGYQATTVEQIAAAAEVSPSTFFRYFPTKEDVVLQDDMEPLILEALERAPKDVSPVAATRTALREAVASMTPAQWDRMRETTVLAMATPEVRARSLDDFSRTVREMTTAMAKRAGRSPDDVEVQAVAGAIFGVILAVTTPWAEWTEDSVNTEMFDRIDAALALLERGLLL